MPIASIAQSCDVTVKKWFNRYETEGFAGLLDRNMAHRHSILSASPSVEATVLDCVEAHPQNLSQAVAVLAQSHQIQTNQRTVCRFLKKKVALAQGT